MSSSTSPHDYMEQCPTCKKYLLYSQRAEHKCAPTSAVKEIPVVFYYETTDEKGEKLIVASGYDGVVYRLIKREKPLTNLSDDFSQQKPSDEDFKESYTPL